MKVATSIAGARPRFGALSAAVAAALAGLSTYVQAQDQAEGETPLEEITVTGSRIVRQDFTANSPIQTVDQQMFEQTSAVGVETILNRLPQFVPAVTQFTTGDVQQTATNTVGASTVSLRGLGPNRNLVLINGRRAMPVDPRMVVDTNSIPSSAIQRVEVISGGASAVYGADAVGGVVNFILKDNYEGASIDVRFGDTEHGGDQTVTMSALIGANTADDRGNVMIGIERDTRAKAYAWQRDWRVEDYANPRTAGGAFAFGSATWWHNEPAANTTRPNPNFNPNGPLTGPNAAFNARLVPNNHIVNPAFNPAAAISAANPTTIANNPTQAAVNRIFPVTGCPHPNPFAPAATNCQISNNLVTSRFSMNRDGTVFGGLAAPALMTPGSYRFNGPVANHPTNPRTGDLDGDFQGLPVFVQQVNGAIKENVLYNWTSIPLERLSGFANGHFDVSDNIRVTGQAMVTRTKTETSLGLAAANINQWGAGIPFGTAIYRGNSNTYFDIPDSLIDRDGDNIADPWVDTNGNGIIEPNEPGDRTDPAYLPGGRYGLNCNATPTAQAPWHDGLPGCTNSEAWPISPEVYNLMITRGNQNQLSTAAGPGANEILWASREPDWMRSALGAGRSTNNITQTMSFTVGVEGDLPSGKHSWDASLYTGRSDNTVNQLGSMRLTSYRDVLSSPNFGRNATFDSNPWETSGFAESTPTCTSGLPIADDRAVTQDCLQMISPALKNVREMEQTIFEANLVGDLAEMRNGPLQYALGITHRENSFNFTPDNLSDIQNEVDPIAGLFPNEASFGEFEVDEIYGELLIPIISDGRTGVEHFNVELGGRISDWSMEQMPNLETYKALMDWGITPRYRLRGGFNRAFRAPNLGELFIKRTQVFGGFGTRDWCSTNLDNPGGFSATGGKAGSGSAQQVAQSLALCQQLMGAQGTAFYYDPARTQDTVGGTGVSNTFGNPNLREEQADTWTLGVAMDILEDFRLTVDYWQIEIENMISVESADTTYRTCLDLLFNPTGDINNSACQRIKRNPTTGGGGEVSRAFTNEGLSDFSGVDVQLNWSKQMENGGGLNLNTSITYNLHERTQDNVLVDSIERAGFNSCALQLQCLNYDYRVFTTVGYGRGMWNVSMTHQYWPTLDNESCRNSNVAVSCIYNSLPDYRLVSLSGNVRFQERYTLSMGIENVLDTDPPCLNQNPTLLPTAQNPFQFPTDCTRTGDGSTYDPLGRRFFISMNFEF
jgi:outer membrane receptor for ferrienterochelin and colicin